MSLRNIFVFKALFCQPDKISLAVANITVVHRRGDNLKKLTRGATFVRLIQFQHTENLTETEAFATDIKRGSGLSQCMVGTSTLDARLAFWPVQFRHMSQ